MTRLIDADALISELLRGINADTDRSVQTEFTKSLCMILCKAIEKRPTVDAVPVIRCKDCKHYYEKEWVVGGGSYTTCWYQTIANAQPNDFCSRAERKTDDKTN